MASSTWRGRIAFGMVSIPVRLYKAARRERIRFHNVYRPARIEAEVDVEEEPAVEAPGKGPRLVSRADPMPVEEEPDIAPVARVRSMPMMAPERPEEAPAVVPKEQMLKAFELEKDRYVVFEPREIAALRPRTSSELAIEEFVHLAEIDPVFFETSYYVEPDQGGEKVYALLYAAMAESGCAAIGEFAMHGREHAAVVRPGRRGLILHTLFYAKEVRAEAEYAADRMLVGEKEKQLALTLVEALKASFDPLKLKSGQEERVQSLIESRAPDAVPVAGSEAPGAPAAPPVDIMEALRKSLAATKKPAARETRPPVEKPSAQAARRPRKK